MTTDENRIRLNLLYFLRRWFCCCSIYLPLFLGVLCWSLFWYALLYALSSFAIILPRKKEPFVLLVLCFGCLVTVNLLLPLHRKRYITRVILHCMHICEMALNPYLIRCLIHDTDMLFLLLKNAMGSSLAESRCLTLALATHTKKIKSFDG